MEDEQRRKERERRLTASNEKMKELSKFLHKCDLNFKRELKEIKKRAIINPSDKTTSEEEEDDQPIYRRPTESDSEDDLVRGRWTERKGGGGGGGKGVPRFMPAPDGPDFAVRVGAHGSKSTETRKTREGLRVLMSDDPNIPEDDRKVFSEFDDPVSDRDMVGKGIVWINANNPTIVERRTKSENDPVFLEMVANYVLMVVAQYHAQKQYDAEPDEEKSPPMLLFREKYFKFQRDLRQDKDVTYFDVESAN